MGGSSSARSERLAEIAGAAMEGDFAQQMVQLIFKIVRTIVSEGTTIVLVEQNAHMVLGVAA